jgi:flagella basal body P-ring formation protein FlgA
VSGERILAGDLGRAIPEFAGLDPGLAIGVAPAPGSRRIVRRAELDRIARQHGLELPSLDSAELCFELQTEPLTAEGVAAALRSAVEQDAVRLEVLDFSRHPVPQGQLEFPKAGLATPPVTRDGAPVIWRGRVRHATNRTVPVWAKVKLSVPGRRVVSSETIQAGRAILATQLRVEDAALFPLADMPLASIEEAAGRVTSRSIRAGTVLYASMLTAPKAVLRGAMVAVQVSSGAARVTFHALAESEGAIGEMVVLRNPLSGRRFRARVTEKDMVVINAS